MDIFLTGGSGYVGSVIAEHLAGAGHRVRALARSEQAARRVAAAGAEPVRGDLADLPLLAEAAASADAIVYAAVDYRMDEAGAATELAAVGALVGAAAARNVGIPVLYTSTGLVYGLDPDADTRESAVLPERSAQPVKAAAEGIVLDAQGIVGVVIRPGLVFGRGGSGLVTGMIDAAAARGVSMFVGDGANAWSPVHVDDLAELYRAVIERPVAGVYNAASETIFTFHELAEQIASLTGATAVGLPRGEAASLIGPQAHVLATNSVLPSHRARQTFAWHPTRRGLIEEIREGGYAAPLPV